MLHTCDRKFDVTGNLENFYELNKALMKRDDNSFIGVEKVFMAMELFYTVFQNMNVLKKYDII